MRIRHEGEVPTELEILSNIMYAKPAISNKTSTTGRAPNEQTLILINITARLQAYANENTPSKINVSSRFTEKHRFEALRTSFHVFVERLANYANFCAQDKSRDKTSTGSRCAIMAMSYLEAFKAKINPLTVHRYFLIAFMLAFKYTEDLEVPNAYWARLGDFPLKDVNRMEASFCKSINWSLKVTEDDFVRLQTEFSTYEDSS